MENTVRASEPSPEETRQLSDIWGRVQDALRSEVRYEQFETWFCRAAMVSLDETTACIAVHNGFIRDWLVNYYAEPIDRALEKAVGSPRRLEFIVDPERSGPLPPRQEPTPTPPEANALPPAGSAPASTSSRAAGALGGLLDASDVTLNNNYRFDRFVVGPCNRFAHAASIGVSEKPGTIYNPLFLHGSVGLGKTHLLQSICHTILDRDPNSKILYLSCETFVNHFISALGNGDLQKFRTKYRNVDLLVVDDIHLLANKERTQEEFFHTFNTLYNAGKQIVLSSDTTPVDIPTLQERLVSRFKWGLVTEVETPCYETRMAILKRKSRARGQELPEEVARLLAEHIQSNIRELEGAVTKVIGFASLSQRAITPELVRLCLPEIFKAPKGQPSIEDILRIVTEHYGVKLSDLQSKKRTNAIAFPRQIGMFLARSITQMSLEEIGGYFGGRDHSTVLYGVQKVNRLMEEDSTVQKTVTGLIHDLRGPSIG